MTPKSNDCIMRKISIVMAYYNRKNLLKFTLDTIRDSKYKNFEIIIVDDASDPEHNIDEFVKDYDFFDIKLIKIDPKVKKHKSPCIPFNIGFKHATGDIIIMQNPECCHVGDVLTYVAENLKEKQYYSMTCAAMKDADCNQDLYKLYGDDFYKLTKDFVFKLAEQQNNKYFWYNHEKYRPYAYHFLSAMPRDVLLEVNGFDERYALGTCFDDIEILLRIKAANVDVIIPPISETNDTPFCIHQWHPTRKDAYAKALWDINHDLFVDHMKDLNIDITGLKFD